MHNVDSKHQVLGHEFKNGQGISDSLYFVLSGPHENVRRVCDDQNFGHFQFSTDEGHDKSL